MWRVRRKPAWLRSEMGNVAYRAPNAEFLSECCVACQETELLKAEVKFCGLLDRILVETEVPPCFPLQCERRQTTFQARLKTH